MKLLIRLLLALFCSLMLLMNSGCGFHLRGTQNLPPQLHTLYLDIEKPDSPFSQDVRTLLLSLHIVLTATPAQAPYILKISYQFTHSTPTITSSTQTVAYAFRLFVMAHIENNQGKMIVPPKAIHLTHSLMMNSNEIYIPNTATFVEEELDRDAINLIYFWLTNLNTHLALSTDGARVNVNVPAPAVAPAPAGTSTTTTITPSATPVTPMVITPASSSTTIPSSLPPVHDVNQQTPLSTVPQGPDVNTTCN